MILPEAIDEIGMSLDRSASSSLIALAASGETRSRPPFVQLKAIETLGRLRETEAVPVLRSIMEDKKIWGYSQHRELRIAAAQALSKIDPRYGAQALSDSGLESARQRRSPAINWKRPFASGRTSTGCTTPFTAMEAASSVSCSWFTWERV